MAKKAILDVLESTIGKYVRNLDAESLNVAVWSGKIELQSLELNTSAVNVELDRQAAEAPNLALPFRVIGGSFESFQVDVPWARITSRPVVLRAKGLKVMVEPYEQTSTNLSVQMSEAKRIAKLLEERANSIKLYNDYRLQANALAKIADIEKDSSEGDSDDEAVEGAAADKSTFTSRLVRRIIENLQVEIDDVHIALKGSGCAAGCMLESLSLVTTDKEGNRTFVDRTVAAKGVEESFLYKSLSIRGFGIYLDEETIPLSSNPAALSKAADHSFILSPLSFQATLRQSDSDQCIDFPKYLLSSELSQLSVLLSRTQLELANKIHRTIQAADNTAKPLFPQYRPLSRVSRGTVKAWWRYAFRSVSRLNGSRSWIEFWEAFKKRRKYIPLYKRSEHHKDCPWMTPLSDDEANDLKMLEKDRAISIEGLMAWRNIADAQAEREKIKHDDAEKERRKNRTYYAYLFGSSETATGEDDPPITLTPEEMKELEEMSLENVTDRELSNDSKLYDVKFKLGSFNVNLTSYGIRPIAALDMGTVSAAFDANADGSFKFSFNLSSLSIWDLVTADSLYPNVFRNLPSQSSSGTQSDAFELHLQKARTGEESVVLKLVAFELVASPLLVIEMKRFLYLEPTELPGSPTNPMLRQSLSGSVDLFYDADHGGTGDKNDLSRDLPALKADSNTSDQVSSAVVEAWKKRTKDKTKWSINCDVHAPVVIVPENCQRLDANVMMFDLGHFRFLYGTTDPTKKVLDWFQSQPRKYGGEVQIDPGVLSVENLTFTIGTTKDISSRLDDTEAMRGKWRSLAVIEPLSAKLDCGVEIYHGADTPRTCAFGVFPSLCLRVSSQQATRSLSVVKAWQKVVTKLAGRQEEEEGLAIIDEESEPESTVMSPSTQKKATKLPVQSKDRQPDKKEEANDPKWMVLHLSVALQRFSLYCMMEEDGGVEAHLVSATTAFSHFRDGTSYNRVCMGWFWILDRLKSGLPRKQRFLAHSTLPRPASKLAESNYDVLGELEREGVFRDDFQGSSGLADISWKAAPEPTHIDDSIVFSTGEVGKHEAAASMIIDAKFASLFLHWNPQAIKAIVSSFDEVLSPFRQTTFTEESLKSSRQQSMSRIKDPEENERIRPGLLVLQATMENLELSLNSARDDLPLFTLSMTSTKVGMLSSADNMRVSMTLGDLRTCTPEVSSTLVEYKTMLGLSPGQRRSLLTVDYHVGSDALKPVLAGKDLIRKCEAYADIQISPMRFVYVQAQVMTLVEFATEGILGALTAQAAASAANAAMELAAAGELGEKVFAINASGIQVVMPQAAHKDKFLDLHAGRLSVVYHSFPFPGGSKSEITLSDLSLMDSQNGKMVEQPLQMAVAVDLPAFGVGTMDEQAMRVVIDISKATFLLTKPQYKQIMRSLDENIGELDPCLRASKEASNLQLLKEQKNSAGDTKTPIITHAGVVFVERQRRMFIDWNIEVLAVNAYRESVSDPLCHLAAVKAGIHMKFLSDQAIMLTEMTLHDLVCDDTRLDARSRQFRSLIEQVGVHDLDNDGEADDVFFVKYTRDSGKNRSEYDLKIGSPQMVFIPDAISEMMSFLSTQDSTSKPQARKQAPLTGDSEIVFSTEGENESIEAAVVPSLYTMDVKAVTKNCRIVLVDLGTSTSVESVSVGLNTQSTESVVMQGRLESQYTVVSQLTTGLVLKRDFSVHGNDSETYTAYSRQLLNPMQIIDPTDFAMFYNFNGVAGKPQESEIRAVTMAPLNITFSMQNAALLNTIMSSLSATSRSANQDQDGESGQDRLSESETARIEKLASALEGDGSIASRQSKGLRHGSSIISNDSESARMTPTSYSKLKMTLPATRLTVVNDMQGLDEALFRVTANNFVAGAEATTGICLGQTQTTFDGHINTALSSDYFDSNVNLWKRLLKKPWELTLKTSRGVSSRFRSNRLSTTVDIESFPCHVSFSEQFLASLSGANRMWGVYSTATNAAVSEMMNDASAKTDMARKALAASAARNLVVSLPYAVDNYTGMDIYFECTHSVHQGRILCRSGCIEYFRFERSRGKGFGGCRLYGQEVKEKKSLKLHVGARVINIHDLDEELGSSRRAHDLGNGVFVVTRVTKKTKSTVLHVGSHVELVNQTMIPFHVSTTVGSAKTEIGVCQGTQGFSDRRSRLASTVLSGGTGRVWKPSTSFSLPCEVLGQVEHSSSMSAQMVVLNISPDLPGQNNEKMKVHGSLEVPSIRILVLETAGDQQERVFDVTCKSRWEGREGEARPDPFVIQVRMNLCLLDPKKPFVKIQLEPRAKVENKIPISLRLKTPMPHTFVPKNHDQTESADRFTEHVLRPNDVMEVFTPGPSVAVSVKCNDLPVAGTTTSWMQGDWVDLPMMSEFRLVEPVRCILPFVLGKSEGRPHTLASGSEFFVYEAIDDPNLALTSEVSVSDAAPEALRSSHLTNKPTTHEMRLYHLSVTNYGIDHTGGMLFEQVNNDNANVTDFLPFSSFSSSMHAHRLTLLPGADVILRLLKLTMDGAEGLKRSVPFCVEDISIGDGGIESSSLDWEDGEPSGFYAYRRLLDTARSEIHVIPEFIIYNGSKTHRVSVRQVGAEIIVEPGQMAPVTKHPKMGLVISLDYFEFGGRAGPLQVDELKHRVAIVKSLDGFPLGSVAVQTVIGSVDSRLVVKLGHVKFGQENASAISTKDPFEKDFLRLRIRWSELLITLNEARPLQSGNKISFMEKALDDIMETSAPTNQRSVFSPRQKDAVTWMKARSARDDHNLDGYGTQLPVCTVVFRRFTIDWQRIWKDDESKSDMRSALLSPERSQLSVIIHNVQVLDETPKTPFPVVFDSTSKLSFFDLCVRLRGSLDTDLMRVDLIDLNLAHTNGISEKISLTTSEDFVWKLLDVINRILVSTAELAGMDMKLEWNEETGSYEVIVDEATNDAGVLSNTSAEYTPPRTDRLFDINKARVSPFTIVVSFKRQPQASRYKLLKGSSGAKLVNYFTTRLKFTLDKAELKFSRYEANNIKGPLSRLIELVGAVYTSRMKMKIVTILSAANFQDWKYLASRDDGDDEFVEGDLLRVTGNLAGKTANFIVKKMGQGIGDGFSVMTHTLGDGIESATGKVGARAVGAGVNSVMSGLGDGVGDTVKGVGTGAGKILKGTGKGLGHIVGGATGAVLIAGKGIGKGVTTGDGRAVVEGFSNAAVSVGSGVGQGVESAVMGAADGFMAVGQGLFSGVKNVGMGIGGAFSGGKKATRRRQTRR